MWEWLPDWFHVSSSFVYAMLAFLGSLCVVHYERRLSKRDEARQYELGIWTEIHSVSSRLIMPMQLVIRAKHLGDMTVHRESVLQVTALRAEIVSVFYRASTDKAREAAAELDDCIGQFLEKMSELDIDRLKSGILNSVQDLRAKTGDPMSNLARQLHSADDGLINRFVARGRQEEADYTSDIMTTSEEGDTPPA